MISKVSAVIITFNEEAQIGRCLDSVAAIADEVVVVDSFSTDRTEDICRQKGAVFIRHAFAGYIAQKNYALSCAGYDYVLSLDADEAVSAEMNRAVLAEKARGFAYDAYRFNRLTNYCGQWIRHGSWYPDRKIRLVNRHRAAWVGIDPHDELKPQNPASVKHLPGNILHYSYDSLSGHISQFNHFSEILAREMFKKNKRAGLINLIVNPLNTFISGYIIRRGMLDGFNGFVIAAFSAFATFAKYVKLIHLRKSAKKPPLSDE